MATRTVTGRYPNYINSKVVFRNVYPIRSEGVTYLPRDMEVTIGGGGAFSMALWVPDTDTALWTVKRPGAPTRETFNLGPGDPVDLDTLI